MNYLAFDLEIAAIIPEGEADWKAYRPLGVTCAATFPSDEEQPYTWRSIDENDNTLPRMTNDDLISLVEYLQFMAARGYTILTWNGLSFDFDVLAEESGMHAQCAELAMRHVDMMYHVFCIRGHYLGLDKVAKGLGLPGKTAGMDGAKAPQMWADGKFAEVLEYVAQDVRTTMAVALEAERIGGVQWISVTGRTNIIDLDRWMPVDEAQRLPLPDTSWMKNPVSRDKFTAWMQP
jgi:hypothetical protein